MQEHPHQAEMLNVVGEYLQSSLSDEGIRERAGERMKRALLHSFIDDELPEVSPETVTPTEAMQGAIMAGYIALVSQVSSVHECEYYFRRYPFRGMPISKGDHLRNCCEFYFDRIVQFRDRLKALLNACKKLQPEHDWRISNYLKAFDRTFASVIRARNHTHHHGRYDDGDISQLALMYLLKKGSSKELAAMAGPHFENVVYRRATQKWRKYVADGCEALSKFCDSTAQLMLRDCDIIQQYRVRKPPKEPIGDG